LSLAIQKAHEIKISWKYLTDISSIRFF